MSLDGELLRFGRPPTFEGDAAQWPERSFQVRYFLALVDGLAAEGLDMAQAEAAVIRSTDIGSHRRASRNVFYALTMLVGAAAVAASKSAPAQRVTANSPLCPAQLRKHAPVSTATRWDMFANIAKRLEEEYTVVVVAGRVMVPATRTTRAAASGRGTHRAVARASNEAITHTWAQLWRMTTAAVVHSLHRPQ